MRIPGPVGTSKALSRPPAGRVEPGERWEEGARREALEESGVEVVLSGILRVEYTPAHYGARQRVFFTASPADDTPPLFDFTTLRSRTVQIMLLAAVLAFGGINAPLFLLVREIDVWIIFVVWASFI